MPKMVAYPQSMTVKPQRIDYVTDQGIWVSGSFGKIMEIHRRGGYFLSLEYEYSNLSCLLCIHRLGNPEAIQWAYYLRYLRIVVTVVCIMKMGQCQKWSCYIEKMMPAWALQTPVRGSGPYKLFLLRSKIVRLIGSLGIGPLNWLELRSIADALISSNLGDREPLIWLLLMFRNRTEEAIVQNQSGTMSDMLVFEISRLYIFVCHLSQVGNLGPRMHDPSSSSVRLKGGTQVEFTLMAMELRDRDKRSKFTRPDKCHSCKSPSRLLELRSSQLDMWAVLPTVAQDQWACYHWDQVVSNFWGVLICLVGFLSDCWMGETKSSIYSMNN